MGDLPLLLLIGVGLWVASKYFAGTNMQFQPRGFSVDGGNFVLKLGVINNSPYPVSFDSFNGQMSLSGSPFALIQDFTPQTLAPHTETDLNLIIQPYGATLITDVINYVKSNASQTVTLTGTLTAENIPINVNQSFTLPSLPI
jgi:hypothetical protein